MAFGWPGHDVVDLGPVHGQEVGLDLAHGTGPLLAVVFCDSAAAKPKPPPTQNPASTPRRIARSRKGPCSDHHNDRRWARTTGPSARLPGRRADAVSCRLNAALQLNPMA